MKIYPQASNAITIELEGGGRLEMHEFDNTLSFSALTSYLKVTAHNVSTMGRDVLGTNYQISLQITKRD